MNPTCNWKTVLLGSASVSILSGIAVKVTQLLITSKQSETINEVLMYGAGEDDKKKQLGLKNLFCVYYVLIHASQTIDVCMPSLHSDTISKCLVNVHQKNNIKVRIIVHNNKNLGLNLKQFLDCGIEVKVMSESDVPLEHEFMLIDALDDSEEALAIIGSLDYEVKRVNLDIDNTLLTAEKAVVCALEREFNRVWNSVVATK